MLATWRRWTGTTFVTGGTWRRWDGTQFVPAVVVGDADSNAFLTAAGITDPTQITAINNLVAGLKGAGLWTKMVAIYPLVGGTAAKHRWNLKDPRDLDAAFRLSFTGPLVHSATGMKPDGTVQSYGDTHLIPADVLTINSMHLTYYSRTDSPVGDKAEIGCYNSPGGIRTHLIIHYNGNLFYAGINEAGGFNVASGTSAGFFASARTSSTLTTAYYNGASVGTSSTGSSALPDIPVYVCQLNGYPSGLTDRECAFASIGVGFSDAEASALSTIVQAFQTTLGRQV